MMEKYILSIAIPTYGYPKAVKKNISHLLGLKRDDVEIVVVDNDSTGKELGEYAAQITDNRFRYYRNKENIGRSANIVRALELSKARHVLIVSSDDSVRLESIGHIIEVIEKYPECGIIMGRIKTDRDIYYGHLGEEHIYRAGYDALCITPRMGVLYPFVVNKEYLDFEKLYKKKDIYMQTRIALSVSGIADFIGIKDIVADAIDQESYREDGVLEYYNIDDFDNEDFKRKWDLDDCYYSPQSRVSQLKAYIEIIESFPLRKSHLIKLVDKMVSQYIYLGLDYVPCCHDPSSIKNGGSVGVLGCEDVLSIFYEELNAFFTDREKKSYYCFCGQLTDKIKNERLVLGSAKDLMNEIINEKKVTVQGDSIAKKKLSGILHYMGVQIVEETEGVLALYSGIYDSKAEQALLEAGAKEVKFFDWMGQYLTIVWVDENRASIKLGPYGDFA